MSEEEGAEVPEEKSPPEKRAFVFGAEATLRKNRGKVCPPPPDAEEPDGTGPEVTRNDD